MLLSSIVSEDTHGFCLAHTRQSPGHIALWVIVQSHDGTEIRSARTQQLEPVILGLAQRALVGQDDARLPWFQAHTSEQASPYQGYIVDGEALFVEIERQRVLTEDAAQAPLREGQRRTCIAVIEVVVVGQIPAQL